jgi:Zn-dependent protease
LVANNSPFQFRASLPVLLILLVAGFFLTRWQQLTAPNFDPASFALQFVFLIAGLVIAITVHEFSHAWSALLLGDHTAESQGRVSLNPVRHIDPFGMLMVVFAGFGWGLPTPVNPWRLRFGPKAGYALVSVAGPISNVVAAIIFALPFYAGLQNFAAGMAGGRELVALLFTIVQINLVLAVFNLLPIAPMDGFKFLLGVLPTQAALRLQRLEPYGPMVLLVLIALPWFIRGVDPLGWVMRPMIDALLRFVLLPI